MNQMIIKFQNPEEVLDFVNKVAKYPYDMDMKRGRFVVDAKSILGIMTMDLRNPMWITANCDRHQGERMMRELDWVAA